MEGKSGIQMFILYMKSILAFPLMFNDPELTFFFDHLQL